MRVAIGVAVGFATFNLIVYLIAISMGAAWPAFDAIENPRDYTAGMLLFRLALGLANVWLCGMIAGLISRRGALAGVVLGIVFEVLFLAVHLFVLYDDFPLWYHAIFLICVVPATWLGGRMAGRQRATPVQDHAITESVPE